MRTELNNRVIQLAVEAQSLIDKILKLEQVSNFSQDEMLQLKFDLEDLKDHIANYIIMDFGKSFSPIYLNKKES